MPNSPNYFMDPYSKTKLLTGICENFPLHFRHIFCFKYFMQNNFRIFFCHIFMYFVVFKVLSFSCPLSFLALCLLFILFVCLLPCRTHRPTGRRPCRPPIRLPPPPGSGSPRNMLLLSTMLPYCRKYKRSQFGTYVNKLCSTPCREFLRSLFQGCTNYSAVTG